MSVQYVSIMKTLLLLILFITVFLGFNLRPAHADYADGISIQNINVQPSVLKVGDTFSITATLVNNSTVPIAVDGGTCLPKIYPLIPFFTVTLDDHAKIKAQNLNCAGVGLGKILNRGESLIGTSPDSTFSYIATKSGAASVTVTFSYHGINQTDPTQAYAEQTISKSFQFTIADNGTSTSYGGLTGFRQAYFQGNHGSYPIWYKLTNGTVVNTLLDLPAKELLFEINTASNGRLIVELPRTVIDSKSGLEDIPYFASVYNIRSLGGPTRVTPQELNDKDQRIVQVDFPQGTTEVAIAGTWFIENNSTNPTYWNPFGSFSPLQQYNKGIASKDIKCKSDLQLIIKLEDHSPACVKSITAQKLVERSWGIINISWIGDHDTSEGKMGTLSGIVSLAGGPFGLVGLKANYEVDVYASNGTTIIGKTLTDAQGNYSIQLPDGNYTIYAPDSPTRQTHFVSVFSGKNTIFNIVYGTGYK